MRDIGRFIKGAAPLYPPSFSFDAKENEAKEKLALSYGFYISTLLTLEGLYCSSSQTRLLWQAQTVLAGVYGRVKYYETFATGGFKKRIEYNE